jgi:hypothetical protein
MNSLGPWTHNGTSHCKTITINTPSGDTVASISVTALTRERRLADARLLAAAWELREVLEKALKDLQECAIELDAGPFSRMGLTMREGNNLLAKIEGEKS